MTPSMPFSHTSPVERGFSVAVLAALAWIALGLESIVRPQPATYRDVLWLLPFVLTAVAFWYMHRVQQAFGRGLEKVGFYSVMTASALAIVGNEGVVLNQPALAVFGFPLGALLWTVGLLVFGAATLRAGVFPRYVGISLMLLEPGSILTGLALSPIAPLHDHGGYSAGVEKGLVLALVAIGFLTVRTDEASRDLLR